MSVFFLMVLFAAVIGSAGMVAVLAWILQRIARLEGASPAELERLLSENAEMRQQIESVRSELHALDERVDFTEKLLEGKRPDRTIGPGS